MKKYLFILFLCSVGSLYGQRSVPDSLEFLFDQQLSAFPQEKIHLHTDKPYYISGEKIWFRAHIADAVSHIPASASGYAYVELINPLDSVVSRVKVRVNEDAYFGHLSIPNDIPEGDYTLRAYTGFMQSLEEAYLYSRALRIGDPQARAIQIETRFLFESPRRVHASFRFSQTANSAPFVPKSASVRLNERRTMDVSVAADGTASIHFDLPTASGKRTLLLELNTSGNPYRQFITVPVADNDFDVSFYPEGGSPMLGTSGKIAFKAMKSNGQAAHVTGVVYSRDGTEVSTFQSEHLGMGSFMHQPVKGESYYAICTNDRGESRRFELPAAAAQGYALAISPAGNRIWVSVQKPAAVTLTQELYLMAHARGTLQFVEAWDHDKNLFMLPKDWLPSGVIHFVLLDARFQILSERLVFIHNNDQAQVSYQSNRAQWAPRTLVKNSINLRDQFGQALEGSFSVSVTSDREVQVDSSASILTQMLLSSDLRGHIENPSYYFENSPESAKALDLLMCTQGWRRYNIAEVFQGRFSQPSTPIEMGGEISGAVERLLGAPLADLEVNIFSFHDGQLYTTRTDKNGRFSQSISDAPDNTRYTVSVSPRHAAMTPYLLLDQDPVPPKTLALVPPAEIARQVFTLYTEKAEQQYIDENGERVTVLPAALVTARRTLPRMSTYYHEPDHSANAEDIKRWGGNLVAVLNGFSGVSAWSNRGETSVRIRTDMSINLRPSEPLLLIDDIPMIGLTIDMLSSDDIERIDILKSIGNLALFGLRGSGGVIAVYTKKSTSAGDDIGVPPRVKTIMPLACQLPEAFYAPKYDTEAARNNSKTDHRTTIHWEPVVQTDSLGLASFEFYTADDPSSYTVVIEGLTKDGKIVRYHTKCVGVRDL